MSEEKPLDPWWMDEEQIYPWGEEPDVERERQEPRAERGERRRAPREKGEGEDRENR